MPSESNAACCIAPDSECATGWPMRTTRFVMLAPFRGRRRSRDRRWRQRPGRPIVVSPAAIRPAIAKVIARRWSSRLSVSAPAKRGAAGDPQVVAVDLDPGAQRAQAGGGAGDPIRFLVAELAGAADDGRALGGRRGQAEDRDLVDRRGHIGRPEVDRAQRGRAHDQVGQRLADAVVGPVGVAAAPSMSAPIARRMSMTARRVGLTPTSRMASSASGWIAPATSQNAAAETSPGTRSVDRCHCNPSFAPSRHRAVGRVRPLDRHAARPQHPFRVVARRDRLADRRPALRPQPRQQDRRLHLRARHRRRVVDRPKRGTTDHGQWWEGVVARPWRTAPIERSGSMIRATGRRRNESSPSRTAVTGSPASMPADQPQARPGVAAIEDRRRVRPGRPPRARRPGSRPSGRRPRPARRSPRAPP